MLLPRGLFGCRIERTGSENEEGVKHTHESEGERERAREGAREKGKAREREREREREGERKMEIEIEREKRVRTSVRSSLEAELSRASRDAASVGIRLTWGWV